MHFRSIFGLILIFLVTKSHSRATEATIFYEDDDPQNSVEDEYYSEEEKETTTISNQNLTTTTTMLPTTINVVSTIKTIVAIEPTSASKILDMSLELPKLKPNCPESCDCRNDFQLVNCSNKYLTNVPNDIPETVLILDLSNNLIEELRSDNFVNAVHIQELILTRNHIKNISEEALPRLENLTHVRLDDNQLTLIHPDTFLNAPQLKMLNLNNNTIELPVNSTFLNQNNLNELHLANNNLTEIYDETFNHLTALKVLKMDSNNFNQKINTRAFKPLKQLSELKLPNLDEDTIKELCEVITTIDFVNFEKFDISCFELSSGSEFDESIVTVNPNSMNQHNVNEGTEKGMTTTSRETKTSSALVVLGTTTQAAAGSSLTSTLVNSESSRFNESLSHTEESYISNKIQDNGDDSEKTYQVAISTQTINHILLAIIIVAVVGLLIGVICRKDICGIKTKLCRTKRPPPTDQVRPAEEVPLNKIV